MYSNYYSTYMFLLLGEGQFGVVHKALAEGICSYDTNRSVVAVKTLKGSESALAITTLCLPYMIFVVNARPSDINDLHSELDTMKKMDPHPNIINILGVCSRPGVFDVHVIV